MMNEHEQGRAEPEAQADAGAPAEAPEAAPGQGDESQESQPVQRSTVEEVAAQLGLARREAQDNLEKLLRARAELDNLRKRHERELEGARKFALDRFVAELLPVRDSLELGLSAAQGDAADVAKLREGKQLTLKLLTDVLGKFGIEEVAPDGQAFNPELHQAISMQPRGDVPAGTVVTVVQKGYTLNGRLVRPAMVIVSSAS